MRIGNERIEGRNALPYTLYRGGRKITLRVTALPLGFTEEVQKRIPYPTPREHVVRDDRGRPLRDDDGKPVTAPSLYDPDFIGQSNERTNLHGVLSVRCALADDPNVTFETEMPDEFGDLATAKKLRDELREAGFTVQELSAILGAADAAAAPTEEQMEEAREVFLSEAPAAPDGPSPRTPEGASIT